MPKDVAAAIIQKEGRVFVTRRAQDQKLPGMWEFPGGKLEPGETPQTAVIRELAEELSIEAEAGDILALRTYVYPGGAINLIGVEVRMTADSWRLTVHDRAEWVTAERLMELELSPPDIPIAKHVCGILSNKPTEAS